MALLGALSVASPGWAQSLSIEEEEKKPEAPKAPASTPAAPPPRPPTVILPTPVLTPVDYPAGGQGEAEVILVLTLSAEGSVTEAVALEGDAPFAANAVAAAKAWKFQPATRDGKPIGAKIRYLVRFVPPVDEEVVEEEPGPSATTPPGGGAATKPAEAPVHEIVVIGKRAPIRHQLGRAEIHEMPGAFGDPFRAIEGLPGVVPIVSGLPYFYVRGAPPGNIGYFFDGIPVPYLYHFAAGPGVFHPAFIERVDLYPGAYPVRYGRFAGAIVAGEMAPPGYRFRAEASIRLIDSGAMVEAPFADGRGTVMLGGRYSYTAAALSLIAPDVSVGYWDYQARSRYQLDADDSVELVAFGSRDYVSTTGTELVQLDPSTDPAQPVTFREEERETTVVDVGFHRLDLRWDRRLDEGNWRNAVTLGRDETRLADGDVRVTGLMIGARSEFEQRLEKAITLRAGADALFESFSQDFSRLFGGQPSAEQAGPIPPDGPPGTPALPNEPPSTVEGPQEPDGEPDFGFLGDRDDFTAGVYADLVWDVAPNVQVTPGLRVDLFVSGEQAALGVDPRITAEYKLSKKLTVAHGLGLAHQAPSFVAPVPGFKPSLAGGLQRALQHSAGLTYTLPAGFTASVAVFQSAFFNMTDIISLVQLESTNDNEVIDFRTMGQAYGAELLIRRNLARDLGGFISYTLSRSVRGVRRLEGPATTDRTHVLNVALSYHLGKDWRIGSRLLLYSGIPARVAYLEAARNPPRTPPFWRLDAKLQKRWYIKRPDVWWGFVVEMLNTTLNKEQLDGSCSAFSCTYEEIGPVTIPIIGFEGAF